MWFFMREILKGSWIKSKLGGKVKKGPGCRNKEGSIFFCGKRLRLILSLVLDETHQGKNAEKTAKKKRTRVGRPGGTTGTMKAHRNGQLLSLALGEKVSKKKGGAGKTLQEEGGVNPRRGFGLFPLTLVVLQYNETQARWLLRSICAK